MDKQQMNDEDAFYCALGRAISEFAEVEDSLYRLYGEIMKPQTWIVSSATYHVQKTFVNKRELVRTALKASYDPETPEYSQLHIDWRIIDDKLKDAGRDRNRIAHMPVIDTYQKTLHIRPSFFNAKSMLNGDYRSPKFNFELSGLLRLRTEFNGLIGEVVLFTNALPLQPLLRR